MVTPQPISPSWAAHFGLAKVPLFSNGGANTEGSHCVLLDDGYGSFALSDTQEPLWKKGVSATWSWSSNLPHHVTVTDRDIAVVRWDKADAEIFTRRSVEDRLLEFYDYLANDRVQSNQRVVEHMLRTFRRIRSLVANARLPDALSIDAYLAVLERVMQSATESTKPTTFVPSTTGAGDSILCDLPESGIEQIVNLLTRSPIRDLPLQLVPSLSIRHAGSEIFQEAHFELLRAPSPNLFGYVGPRRESTRHQRCCAFHAARVSSERCGTDSWKGVGVSFPGTSSSSRSGMWFWRVSSRGITDAPSARFQRSSRTCWAGCLIAGNLYGEISP